MEGLKKHRQDGRQVSSGSRTVTTGFSAFCLTPTTEIGVDLAALERVVARPVAAGVDSMAVLGSTGGYAYLNRAERAQVLRLAVEHADGTPVIAGVGALRTRDVLQHIEDAQAAGVAAVLLAPMTYQPLRDDEVYSLYQAVDAALSVPLIVYDNPTTTHVNFSDDLHGRISRLPSVVGV
ncbi:MAG: dihydrodipicolinate synthase family protein [Trueperaceae bacterium]